MKDRIMCGFIALLSFNVWTDPCFDTYQMSNSDRAVEPGQTIAAVGVIPTHCIVRGVVNRAIQFELRMPLENWNGRFLMMGNGGSAGYIADTTLDLYRGYAIASTNTGHVNTEEDFPLQPEAALDFAFRGVHMTAATAKDIVQNYYGQGINYAYFQGCSGGGRQGLVAATRYPEDFDGIIAGAPVHKTIRDFLLWSIHASRAQDKHPLGETQFQLLGDASRRACDELDGIKDGVINDPRMCTLEKYDPSTLLCEAGKEADTCLTEGQLSTVMAHYEGLVDEEGNVVAPGLVPGAEAAGDWTQWLLPDDRFWWMSEVGLNRLTGDMLKWWVYKDPGYDQDDFDLMADREDLTRASNLLDVNTANLTAFRKLGGKVLLYQGWNDYPVRPQQIIDYLQEVEAANGGPRKTREFFQLFMVPGMTHCSNGPGAWEIDYLEPLVQWVEKNKRPNTLIGSRPDGAFTRTHCPFPKIAKYTGGDETKASSYRCRK